MIPKIIHYCWYGKSAYTPEIEMCIASWKKFCPHFELKRWDESNTPMDIKWIKDAYRHKKYAFVADYVRFYALYHEGGIYMDTDMLLLKPLDYFLEHSLFAGLQDSLSVNYAIVGAKAGNTFNKECLDYYDSIKFDMVSPPIITHIITDLLKDKGFKEIDIYQCLKDNIVLYPTEYFYPIHYTQVFELYDMHRFCTKNSVGIHLWNKSWTSEFSLFEKKEYKKGFKMVKERLMSSPILPLKYYKKLLKYSINYIIKK